MLKQDLIAGDMRVSNAEASLLDSHLADLRHQLSAEHLRMLSVESGISAAVIAARGYRTSADSNELYRLGFSVAQARRVPGLLIPIHSPDGQHTLYRFRPDNPRVIEDKRKKLPDGTYENRVLKYEQPKGQGLRMDCSPVCQPLLANPKMTLWICEGEKKGDALASRGLCAISLPGVFGFKARNQWGGIAFSNDWDYVALNGREVHIVFDSDIVSKHPVQLALDRLSEHLERKGAVVSAVYLPNRLDGGKLGVDDFLAEGHSVQELVALVEAPRPSIKSNGEVSDPTLPTIVINRRQLRAITTDALNALVAANNPPRFFTYLGQVVRIVANENQRPAIELITLHILRNRLARCANFVKQTNDGHRDIEPPISVALDLLASEQLPFPSLAGIVEAPILRPDGTLLQSPGYDGTTRLFYLPASDLQGCDVPDHPTSDDVESARATMADTVGEFPFVDRASLANLYALLLTPILRPAFKGHVPLAIIDAPQAGTGKGLLSNCVSLIASGHSASMTTLPDNEEEVRKRLTALLLDGPNIIVIDNIERPLGSPSLAAILTSDVWTDRVLGRTETVSLPQRATWIANGNNLQLCGDLPRRSYWIRLDARMARPWERQSFRHPDLSTWVLQNRGKLLAALLTLARYWYTLGCPAVAVRPLGGFETWTNTVGGVLAAAGIAGFLENQELVYSRADAGDSRLWARFLLKWFDLWDGRAVTVAEICAALTQQPEFLATIPDELTLALPDEPAQLTASSNFRKRLGKALARNEGKWFSDDGLYLERAGEDAHTKVTMWRIVRDMRDTRLS